MASSALESLPNELLVAILEFVYLPRKNYYSHPDQACLGTRDLLSVIHCSHRLRIVGRQILWRRLVQTNSRVLPAFIRMALLHPELAAQLHRVELYENKMSTPENEYVVRDNLSAECLKAIAQWVCYNEDSAGVYRYGHWISLASFALSLTPNVEMLEIYPQLTGSETRFCQLEDAFLRSSRLSEQPQFLPKLRVISFSFEKRSHCPGLRWMIPFMLHQPLREFYGTNIQREEQPWIEYSERPRILLKKIYFEKSNIHMDALVELLARCTSLESFTYDHDQQMQEQEFIPSQLISAIPHLKPCLKELSLFRRECLHQQFDTVTTAGLGTIGSLSQFAALTNLSITAHLLLGYQHSPGSTWSRLYRGLAPDSTRKLSSVLPRSIEKLRLMNCGDLIFKDVQELVEQKEFLVPNLKSVVLEFQDLWYNKYDGGFVDKMVRRHWTHKTINNKLLDGLEETCKNKGIELDVWYN